jgi:DNA-binding FadR family transcriptional regulator
MMSVHARRHTEANTVVHREVDRYNAAFEELGLEWRLEGGVYARYAGVADEHERIVACIEAQYPHLLKAYDRSFLHNVIREAQAQQAHSPTPRGRAH